VFSFMGDVAMHPAQRPCWITHTTEQTHEIIRGGLDVRDVHRRDRRRGAALLPVIEDKITRFATRRATRSFLNRKA